MQLKVKEMGQLRLSQKTQKPKNYKVVNLQIWNLCEIAIFTFTNLILCILTRSLSLPKPNLGTLATSVEIHKVQSEWWNL